MMQTILILFLVLSPIAYPDPKSEQISSGRQADSFQQSGPSEFSASDYLLPETKHQIDWPKKLTFTPQPPKSPAAFKKELEAGEWTSHGICNGEQPHPKSTLSTSSKTFGVVKYRYENSKVTHFEQLNGHITPTCTGTYEITPKDNGNFFLTHNCIYPEGRKLPNRLVTPVIINETEEHALLVDIPELGNKPLCKDGTRTIQRIFVRPRKFHGS